MIGGWWNSSLILLVICSFSTVNVVCWLFCQSSVDSSYVPSIVSSPKLKLIKIALFTCAMMGYRCNINYLSTLELHRWHGAGWRSGIAVGEF